MTNVQFDAEATPAMRRVASTSPYAGLTGWLVKNKFATDRRGAERLMLITAGISIVVALATPFLLQKNSGTNPSDTELQSYIRAMKSQAP